MRPSEKLAALITVGIFIISGFAVYKTAQQTYGTEIPQKGGKVREGVIGYARFINPLLASSDADKDLTTLVYSGLLKPNNEGKLIGDLAESWSISPDGLIYTVKIRPDVSFHDGEPVTADDIEFTLQKAVDPAIKSPKAANWSGVTIAKISPYEMTFTLKKPYAPFAENLTLGILPKHIWETVATEAFDVSSYNKEPIGSGPYKIKSTKQDASGLYQYYEFESFKNYALGEPYIKKIIFNFYKNEEGITTAFKDGDIDIIGGISSDYAQSTLENSKLTIKATLPRTFGLYFNQNTDPVLINKEVRKALNISTDRDQLIIDILKGYGTPSYSPLPSHLHNAIIQGLATTTPSILTAQNATSTKTDSQVRPGITTSTLDVNKKVAQADRIIEAKTLLEASGWKLGTTTDQNSFAVYEKTNAKGEKIRFAFTISTSNSPELKHMADLLKEQWAKIGADVKVDVYESSDLTQKIIRPRKYSALLFGQVTDRDMDLYPFWHSSQRVDPGLNIALYANINADKALETARSTSDILKQATARTDFEKEILNDIPAIFLFSPDYIYASNSDIKNIDIDMLTDPSERLSNIHTWYIDTKFTWKKKGDK